MYKFAVFFLLISQVSCENYSEKLIYNLTVYRTIDSEPERLSIDKIRIEDDAFHLILANETIPKLYENSVEIQDDLTVLQILNSSLTEIVPGALRIVPTLALLKISANLLTTVRRGVFNDVKVKEIDLSNNFISVIDEDAFDNNTYLEILKLNYNAIKEVSPDWFTDSPNVYQLGIIYNEVAKLPANVFKNLVKNRPLKLGLSANMITDIDADAFNDVGDIDILKLNGNKLTKLPSTLFINRTIRVFQVNSNSLLCFPEELYESKVENLEFLENSNFECTCLKKVKEFVDENNVDIMYPAIICEDRAKEINLVFNFNKTYEIPLLTESTG